MTNGGLTQYKINQLFKQMDDQDDKIGEIQKSVELILTNHLPHIKEDIIGAKTTIKVYTGVNIAIAVLGIIVAKVLK